MKTRFSRKLDNLMWWIIALLPIILYCLVNFRNPNASDFFSYVNAFQPFTFISDIVDGVFTSSLGHSFPLTGFVSYMVSVEIVHLFFDFLVFLPRLCHKWMAQLTQME